MCVWVTPRGFPPECTLSLDNTGNLESPVGSRTTPTESTGLHSHVSTGVKPKPETQRCTVPPTGLGDVE